MKKATFYATFVMLILSGVVYVAEEIPDSNSEMFLSTKWFMHVNVPDLRPHFSEGYAK